MDVSSSPDIAIHPGRLGISLVFLAHEAERYFRMMSRILQAITTA